MNDYQAYLSFAIGPVQPFIEAARRAQDLFVGSRLLSLLAEAACDSFEQHGGQLIYPARHSDQKQGTTNIPNKLLVGFTEENAGQVVAAAEAAEQAVRRHWQDMAAAVYDWTKSNLQPISDELDERLWQEQIDTALEVYWTIASVDDIAKLLGIAQPAYSLQVDVAEGLLAARKLVRDFRQYGQEQYGPMSSIGGSRPAMRGRRLSDVREFWRAFARKLNCPAMLPLDGDEHLDAVTMVKRFICKIEGRGFSSFSTRYPSTSDIAAADLRAGIIRALRSDSKDEAHKQLANQLAAYKVVLEDLRDQQKKQSADMWQPAGNIPALFRLARGAEAQFAPLLEYDGDLIFSQNISAKMLISEYGLPEIKNNKPAPTEDTKRRTKQLAAATNALVSAAKKVGIYCTSPYYAVVAFDGDRMGALLRKMQDAKMHQAFSRALADFAEGPARNIVESDEYLGQLIYAGGDDVLAVFPITTVLDAVTALQNAYRNTLTTIKELDSVQFYYGEHPLATASCGIAIAHHLTPLDFVLAEARRAEKQAKNEFGRNALALRILRRSGEHSTTGYQFGYTREASSKVGQVAYDQLKPINQLALHFATGKLSSRLIYDFAREEHALSSDEMAMSELYRLFTRHSQLKDDEISNFVSQDKAGNYSGGLVTMHHQMKGAQLAAWLGVAEFIARGGGEE